MLQRLLTSLGSELLAQLVPRVAGGAPTVTMGAFQAAGTPAAGTGTIAPAWPTHQAGDIGLLIVTTANEVITLSDAQGFVEVPDSPQANGTVGANGAVRVAVYWCRATGSSMTAPTVADAGNHQYGVIITFRSCVASGDPWDVTAGDNAAAGTAVTLPGDTTTGEKRLVVLIVGHSVDLAAGNPQLSGWTNTDLANVTEQFDDLTDTGSGSGIAVATGEKAVAGAFGSTTATLATSSTQGRIVIALKPQVT